MSPVEVHIAITGYWRRMKEQKRLFAWHASAIYSALGVEQPPQIVDACRGEDD